MNSDTLGPPSLEKIGPVSHSEGPHPPSSLSPLSNVVSIPLVFLPRRMTPQNLTSSTDLQCLLPHPFTLTVVPRPPVALRRWLLQHDVASPVSGNPLTSTYGSRLCPYSLFGFVLGVYSFFYM